MCVFVGGEGTSVVALDGSAPHRIFRRGYAVHQTQQRDAAAEREFGARDSPFSYGGLTFRLGDWTAVADDDRLYRPENASTETQEAQWLLRNSDSESVPRLPISYGIAGDFPLATGREWQDHCRVFASTGEWRLRNSMPQERRSITPFSYEDGDVPWLATGRTPSERPRHLSQSDRSEPTRMASSCSEQPHVSSPDIAFYYGVAADR